jgi:radical SAM protein with 4Fe4S-binding SPASM domain
LKGREWYREFHEQDHEHSEIADDVEEVEPDGCPDCKHDSYCVGGCKTSFSPSYKFEKREEEES